MGYGACDSTAKICVSRTCRTQVILRRAEDSNMARRALLGLILGGLLGGVIPVALGQAIAESAVIHAGSGISAGVARSLGGHIQQSLSNSQSQFSYPPRRLAQTRNRRGRARTRSTSGSPIAIRSVQGGQAPCRAAAK